MRGHSGVKYSVQQALSPWAFDCAPGLQQRTHQHLRARKLNAVERLLELAAECGYVFDEHEFSFVAVRDRIRCYYKSYVQSLKKRGIVIGYAARKAGLVTNDDLEKSACKKSTIYVPNTMKH